MAKVIAPNKQYNGETASVPFTNGVGQCSDPRLLDWFKAHGYTVVEEPKKAEAPKAETKKAPKAGKEVPTGVSTETPGSEEATSETAANGELGEAPAEADAEADADA